MAKKVKKTEEIEHLDLLPEPEIFIDDFEQDRVMSLEDYRNAQSRAVYYLRRAGTRLDRG